MKLGCCGTAMNGCMIISKVLVQLLALVKKLQKDSSFEEYQQVLMGEYAQLGAIEPEPNPSQPGYYMPHHAVVRKDAGTTKSRVVFNASAKVKNGKALNDVIDPGPLLLPDLTGLLLRFRWWRVAVQADIRKAFFYGWDPARRQEILEIRMARKGWTDGGFAANKTAIR